MKEWIINRYNGIVFGRTNIGEYLNAINSLRAFFKYRFKDNSIEQDRLKAFIIKQYHIIEKGMSLPQPRQNFGVPKIKILLEKAKSYEERYGYDIDISDPIRNCLIEYLALNANLSSFDNDFYKSLLEFINTAETKSNSGGVKTLSKEELTKLTNFDYESFVLSRTSVRNFMDIKVDHGDINKAVNIARNSPSVCNRQNWKLHYYDDLQLKTELLSHQHGTGGFTDSIQGLFIITSNLKGFTKMEQSQVFTDGGIISMSLMLALHHVGIGSCALNTCFPYTRERKIRRIASIPKNERLIMMIGIGYWKDEFKVAFSKKKEVEEILAIH